MAWAIDLRCMPLMQMGFGTVVLAGGLVVLGAALVALGYLWRGRDSLVDECFRLAGRGEVDLAAAKLQAAIAKGDPRGKRSESLGFLMYREGRWVEAADAFRNAWRIDPKQPRHCVNLVMALAKGGRHEEAQACLNEARREHPQRVAYACAACLVSLEMGQLSEAERQLRQAESLAQTDSRYSSYEAGLLVECHEQLAGLSPKTPGR